MLQLLKSLRAKGCSSSRNSNPRRRMICDHVTADTLIRPPEGANCTTFNGSSVERTRTHVLHAFNARTPTTTSCNSLAKIQNHSRIKYSNKSGTEIKSRIRLRAY